MLLTNKVYDALKWVARYLLPASATLYFALARIWGLPYGEEVVGSIAALTIFLGVILGISTNAYINSGADVDGVLEIDKTNPEKDIWQLQLNEGFDILSKKDKVTFKVDQDMGGK